MHGGGTHYKDRIGFPTWVFEMMCHFNTPTNNGKGEQNHLFQNNWENYDKWWWTCVVGRDSIRAPCFYSTYLRKERQNIIDNAIIVLPIKGEQILETLHQMDVDISDLE